MHVGNAITEVFNGDILMKAISICGHKFHWSQKYGVQIKATVGSSLKENRFLELHPTKQKFDICSCGYIEQITYIKFIYYLF